MAALAFEYRQQFKRDVVIDLVGYRRWGHNEGDEPSYTQPLMYAKIKSHTSVAQLYGEQLVRQGVVTREELDALWAEKKAEMQQEGAGGPLAAIARRAPVALPDVDAAAMWGRLRATLKALGTRARGLRAAPQARALREEARRAAGGEGRAWTGPPRRRWPSARCCSKASPCGCPARTPAAAPSASATPSSTTCKTGKEYVPLNALAPPGARFEVHDSLLSEAAVMGFEFGYAVAEHRALVHVGGAVRRLLERRAGDHRPVPRRAPRQKWGQPTGLTLLLPHGHEGQGPEHSSARIERFLTLCAEDNMRVVLSLDARVVLPPAAPAGPRPGREAAGGDDAQEPAAAPALRLVAPGAGGGPLPGGARRRGGGPGRVRRVVLD